jgi:hypothetical protein
MNGFPRLSRFLVSAALFYASVGLGCASNPAQPSQLEPGQPFELRSGTSASSPAGLKITFHGVTTDSRCPMDVVCVWAGDAIIAVSLSQTAGGQAERELHTTPNGSEATYLAYSITLVALAPYPRSDRQIRPEDYVATLTVKAR